MPALLSLVFAPGRRPRADEVADLAERERSFSISHRPSADEGWLELLINGLTFDLHGLASAASAPVPQVAHRYGLAPAAETPLEAIALSPGPHLGAGRAMPPVIRGAAALAAALCGLAEVRAVCWHAARSAVGREAYARSVAAWLAGGAFPALGLTAVYPCAEGRQICSEGLSLFTGQELCLERSDGELADDAKLAVRLIDRLVVHGPLTAPLTLAAGPACEVRLEPQGGVVRARQKAA